ncbi:hypothetical protein SAMN05444354_116175 [Stigmatella aurantiaca]|uniref:Uncharacterized protein n=1 Tax=Stigmatella aurantiaca TaxID=41 RepID=A0A1H7YAD6_STIAU|nr:hypothetical protein SAMN05444354_116175 [Stigmatella aurantiaca]
MRPNRPVPRVRVLAHGFERLHRLDPEAYLRDLLRVPAHWPRERYLELAPKYWAATRARLVAAELDAEVGELTLPEPLAAPAEEQSSPR